METFKLWIESAETMTGLPRNALLATVVVALGWLLAFIVRALVSRFVRNVGRLIASRAADGGVEHSIFRHHVDVVLARGAFWLTVLLTLMTATRLLDFPVVSTWLGAFAAYLPRILAGFLIVVAGMLIGSLGRSALVRALPASDVLDRERLGGFAQSVIIVVSFLVALQQLGIDVGFLTSVFTIALVGFLAAGALAFGFGGRTTVANILASHYVRELYEIGHTVRVHGLEGRIVRMTPTAVILSTSEGETAVPAQLFVEASSTRLTERGRL